MGTTLTAAELTFSLARHHRVLMIGGLAVIGHGLSRSTHDSDVWLDPELPVIDWCAAVRGLVAGKSGLAIVRMGDWAAVGEKDFPRTRKSSRIICAGCRMLPRMKRFTCWSVF